MTPLFTPTTAGALALPNRIAMAPLTRASAFTGEPGIVDLFVEGAKRAIRAGFDGVQIHGAHGYLVDQFLRDSVNDRTDGYGGSIENRARLLLEIVDAVSAEIGAGRVSVRISPLVAFNDIRDSQPIALVEHVARELDARGIAFLEIRHGDQSLPEEQAVGAAARRHFRGPLFLNGGFDAVSAAEAIASGRGDVIVFGRPFIANPDLVERLQGNAPLAEVDFSTLYTPGPKGYTDYPTRDAVTA